MAVIQILEDLQVPVDLQILIWPQRLRTYLNVL